MAAAGTAAVGKSIEEQREYWSVYFILISKQKSRGPKMAPSE
jgi:hypothetical protein